MITTSDLKADISIVSKVPAIDKRVDVTEKEIEKLYKELQKKKGDATLGKSYEAAKKELQKEHGELAVIETALGADYDSAVTMHKAIADALKTASAEKDLPKAVTDELKKQTTINEQTRKRDLAYLQNLKTKRLLREEPLKLKRIAEELNADKKEFNALEKTIDGEIDKAFLVRWETVKTQVKTLLTPIGGDNPGVNAKKEMEDTLKKLQASGWKNFDAVEKAMRDRVAASVTESERRVGVSDLMKEFPNTHKKRFDIIDKARNSKQTVEATRKELQEALDKQRKPSKSQWTQHLGMTGYKLASADKVGTYGVHMTWDKNAWGPETDAKIDVSKHTAKAIMDKLFGAVNWGNQIHMTLEAPHMVHGKETRPHAYYGGVCNHFESARIAFGEDKQWVTTHQSGLEGALTRALAKIQAKIQTAIDLDGAI